MNKLGFYDNGGLDTQYEGYYYSSNLTTINGTGRTSHMQLTDFTVNLKRDGDVVAQTNSDTWLEPYVYCWFDSKDFPSWYLFSSFEYEVKGRDATYKLISDKPKNSPVYLMGYREIGSSSTIVGQTSHFRWDGGAWQPPTPDASNNHYTLFNQLDNPEWLGMNPIPTNGGLYYCVWTEEESPTQANYHFVARSPFAGTTISSQPDRLNALMNFFNGDGTLDFWFRGSAPAQEEDIKSLGIADFDETGIASFEDNDKTYYVAITNAIWSAVPVYWYINGANYGTRYMPICYVDSKVAEAGQLQTGYSPNAYGIGILSLNTSTHELSNSGQTGAILNDCYPGAYDCEFKDSDLVQYQSKVIGNALLTRPSQSLIEIRLILKPKSIACALGQYLKFTARAARAYSTADGGTILEDEVWYPIYTNDYKITGKFVRGDDPNFASKVADWQTGDITSNELTKSQIPDTHYDPEAPDDSDTPVPHNKTDEKDYGIPIGSGSKDRITPPASVKYYILTAPEAENLERALWSQAKKFYNALNIIDKTNNDSLFKYISSFRYYPVDFNAFTNQAMLHDSIVSSTRSSVYMGTGAILEDTSQTPATDFQFYTATATTFNFTVGQWMLSDLPWSGTFLDYNPYSKLVVSIPYVEDTELDINTIASTGNLKDMRLILRAQGDLNAGSLTYVLTVADSKLATEVCNLKIATIQLGIDIPLSGNDVIAQSNNVMRANFKAIATCLAVGGAFVAGLGGLMGPGLAAATAEGAAAASAVPAGFQAANFAINSLAGVNAIADSAMQTSLAKRDVPVSQGTTFGTISATAYGQVPYISLYKQKINNPRNYGHTTGYVCESALRLSDVSGFTKLSNPDLSNIAGATAEEINELGTILTAGFFVGEYQE